MPVEPPAVSDPVRITALKVEAFNVPPLMTGMDSVGADRDGAFWNTSAPVPVSSVTAEARFALLGVARNVATPVPSPEIPVATGNPVQFVKVPLAGVPRTGADSVGELNVPPKTVGELVVGEFNVTEFSVPPLTVGADNVEVLIVPLLIVGDDNVKALIVGALNVTAFNVPPLMVGVDSVGEFCSTMPPVPVTDAARVVPA